MANAEQQGNVQTILLLKMSPASGSNAGAARSDRVSACCEKEALFYFNSLQLPIAVYETIVDASDAGGGDNTNIQFVAAAYQMAAEQIERIGVEHVARHAGAATAAAQLKTIETSATDTNALREFLRALCVISSCRL